MKSIPAYFNWSTGKDSALALYRVLNAEEYSVKKLVTSINGHYDRVSMHGLRREMMELQIKALNIPSQTIELSEKPTMEEYEQQMTDAVNDLKSEGLHTAVFGDIFLEDLKAYREKQLSGVGVKCVFPLWKEDTKVLLQEFLDLGFKAITVCVDAQKLGEEFVGRIIDEQFIKDLPEDVDPCGENGEFHTFCFAGPIFKEEIKFKKGEVVKKVYPNPTNKDEEIGFLFCDILPE